jgi:hypothetical protein
MKRFLTLGPGEMGPLNFHLLSMNENTVASSHDHQLTQTAAIQQWLFKSILASI